MRLKSGNKTGFFTTKVGAPVAILVQSEVEGNWEGMKESNSFSIEGSLIHLSGSDLSITNDWHIGLYQSQKA